MTTAIYKVIGVVAAAVLLAACGRGPTDTGREYAPQMYVSDGYEPYSQTRFNPNLYDTVNTQRGFWGSNLLKPVKHTIARGKMGYEYAYDCTLEDYERAGAELKNPLEYNTSNLEEGKRLYGINCSHCHGATGQGDGNVPKTDKYPAPPAYNSALLVNLPEGKMFHTITCGKNAMGSHASQLSPEQRWKVIFYVQNLQGKRTAPGTADATISAQ